MKEEITEKAMDYTKFVLNENEKTKVFSMMALSNLCKYYRNYFSISSITDKNLVKGDTKISKLSEEQTLWCSFELEDIIQRSFRTLTRLIEEYDYEDLQNPNQRKIKDFKNEFVVVEFSKIYQKELINLRNLNFCHNKVCIFKYLAYLCSDKFRSRGLLIVS